MCLARGVRFPHAAVREWDARGAPLLAAQRRAKRQGHAGRSWDGDATSVKLNGQWCSRYRSFDQEGTLVDAMLSETRDRDAAPRVPEAARGGAGQAPTWVTPDGHPSYPRAIRARLGADIEHRCTR